MKKENTELEKVVEEKTLTTDTPTIEEKTTKQTKKSNKVFAIILIAILIVGLMVGAFLLGQNFANKEDNKNNEEENKEVKKATYDKEKYKHINYLYMTEDGYYCGNKSSICTEKALEIPSETEEIDILDYQPYVNKEKPRFILYRDNGFKLYDTTEQTIEELDLTTSSTYYNLHLSEDSTEIIGVSSGDGLVGAYYNLKLKKNMYVNEYQSISAISDTYLSATKTNDDEDDEDDETFLLHVSEEKVEMKATGICKFLSVEEYKDKRYYIEYQGCVGGSVATIYSVSKAVIAENKASTDYSFDDNGYLYVLNNNKVEKYNTDGKLLSTSKSYENVMQLIKEFVVYKEDNKVYITDGKTTTKITDWEDGFYFHSALSGYYDEGSLVEEEGKDAGIYLVFEYGQFAEGPGVEYYYNTETKEVKKYDLEYIGGYAKPVLYLYPEEETEVTVNFEHEESLTTTYPKFQDEWTVTAHPNGDLYDENGNYYYGLYWEENSNHLVDFKEGFYVSKDNAISFLEEKLTIIGLNAKERNEFIMYWLPILEKNEHNLVYFELTEERESFNKLEITPTPDSLLRVAIHVKKIDGPQSIKEQKLTTFERTGFTAVEWGGVSYK